MAEQTKQTPKPDNDPRVIHLSKPIKCHGETHKKLMLPEEVLVEHLESVNFNLVNFGRDTGIKINIGELIEPIAVLTGMSETAIKDLAAQDLFKVVSKVMAFFGLGDLLTHD